MNVKEKLGVNEDLVLGTTSSSPFTGSPTFDTVPFHVVCDCSPTLNTFVLIEREDAVIQYGRIVQGQEENPRADPNLLQKNTAYMVGEKEARQSNRSPHVTRTMTIELLGEIYSDEDELKIREPETLSQTGKKVWEFPTEKIPWLLNLPEDRKDGFHVGYLESGHKKVDIVLPIETIPRQTTVNGKTGTGKSYGTGVMVEEMVRLGIPVISFDILGDLLKATDELGGKNYRAGFDFKVPYSTIGLSEFSAFVNLTREQREIVESAYEKIADEAHDILNKKGEMTMPYQRLYDEITAVGTANGQVPVANRANQRVRAAFDRNELLTERTQPWLEEITKKPVINIFIGHLSQHKRSLVVASAARMLQTLRRRNQIPPFCLIIDEAHLMLPSGGEHSASTAVLREMVRTARHDTVGAILVTQSPSSMDRGTLLACNTRFVFALDRDDLRLVSGTMSDLSDAAINRIPKLPKGTAVISASPEIIRHTVQVRIRTRETTPGAPTPDMRKEVEKWQKEKLTNR